VESVSSFIGADGTNTTLNSGRIEINLKPLDERKISATRLIQRLGPKLAQVPGIVLYMQPVQDLTVDDRVSRTQYQYTVEDPNQNELNTVVAKLMSEFRQLPELTDVATDQQLGGVAESVTIDRATASRFGITPVTVDNTLYDAFGQRQINTMYTQLNQYHVILEIDPKFQADPAKLNDIYIQSAVNGSSPSSGSGPNTAGSSSGAGAGATASSGNALLAPATGANPSLPATSTSAVSTLASRGNNVTNALAPVQSNPVSAASSTPNVLTAASTTTGISSSPNTSLNGTTRSTTGGAAPAGGGGGGGAAPAGAALAVPVPLSALTRFETRSEALSVTHQGQFPAVTVSFNLGSGYSLGQALTAMNKAIEKADLPPSVVANYQGTAAAFEGSLSNQGLLILAALVTVYIVLGVLYESFVHPVTILSTLPSAGVGALLALLLFHLDLDIVSIIGIILLIGIVKKNGIMMVDFALEAQRNEGRDATEAIYQASLLRFRPIMMTTMAALLSGIPLAFGMGIGSELRRPLGVSMVGGLLLSQVLTLYTTPVIYIFFDNLGARLAHRRARLAGEQSPEPV